MKRENGYLDDDSAIIYVMDNCSSTALKHLDSGAIFEVSVGEEDEDDYECMCECDHCVNRPETSVSKKNMIKLLTECVMRLMKQDRNIMNLRIL